MGKTPTAAILAIGTEITTGQIADANAAWLAEQLSEVDWDVRLIASVPDDMDAMVALIEFAACAAQTVIVTGGLGPTRDDFTREAIARWCGEELVYDLSSWTHIEERLARLGITTPPETNRQQCFFPRGAKVLTNKNGTANAFQVRRGTVELWSLPGPPSEVKGIWADHMAAPFALARGHADRKRLLRWHCIGQSEARLGELVEAAIGGSSLVSGYRPHMPYVEIKLWCPEKDWTVNQKPIAKMEAAISQWVIGKDDADLARDLWKALSEVGRPVTVVDYATRGRVAQRLGDALSRSDAFSALNVNFIAAQAPLTGRHTTDDVLLTVDQVKDDTTWATHVHLGSRDFHATHRLPYRVTPALRDRLNFFMTELSVHHWLTVAKTLASQ